MTSGTTGLPVRLRGLDRRLEDRARLHLGDFRIGDGEAAAAEAEHRIELVQAPWRDRASFFGSTPIAAATSAISSSPCGRNSCSGGSSSRIVTGRPSMISNSSTKSLALHRQQLGERRAARRLVVGEDHLAHRADAVLVEEHVLGAAQPDALGAELHRGARVGRRVGVGAHPQLARLVGPAHQRGELAGQRRLDHRHLAGQHLAGRAVDGDDLAALERRVAGLSSSARV